MEERKILFKKRLTFLLVSGTVALGAVLFYFAYDIGQQECQDSAVDQSEETEGDSSEDSVLYSENPLAIVTNM